MKEVDATLAATKLRRLLIGLALLAAAGAVLYFTSGFVFQAFRGPRPIADQALLGITDPGSGDNYVSFSPSRPFLDPGLQWGTKGNPGTKFLLLPVDDQHMLCSARIANDGPTFTGRLQRIAGGTEEEALNRIKGTAGNLRVMPIMLQAVRSIWFDTAVALAAIVGLALGGLWMVLRALLMKGERVASEM
ncbi:MAG: hypothetical protein L0215_17530 [Gemmataceae bacterium]|nr:hypothetical protein [Gemmataceae bacterium]